MTESKLDIFLSQLPFSKHREVTSEEDSESRGERNLRRVKIVVENLNDPTKAEVVDDYIRERVKAYRGNRREIPSGSAGEVLTRLSALTGADLNDLIDPDKDPVVVIRTAYKNRSD